MDRVSRWQRRYTVWVLLTLAVLLGAAVVPTPWPYSWIPAVLAAGYGLVAGGVGLLHRRAALAPAGAVVPIVVGRIPSQADWFQNRDEGEELLRSVRAGHKGVLTYVLTGLAGSGKTQLAAHVARVMGSAGELDLLVWIFATDRESIVVGYAETARTLSLSGPDTPPSAAADHLLSWLEHTDQRWLIVLDNLDTPGDAANLWPPDNPRGRTIVTTRRRHLNLDADNRNITVGLLTPAEAATYLTRATGTNEPPAEVNALAADLGFLPLALSLAAVYIIDRGIDCATYRRLLRESRLSKTLSPADALSDAHYSTFAATWTLAVQAADDHPPRGLARRLLQVAALLDPNGIPYAVFTTTAITEHLSQTGAGPPDARTISDGLRNLHGLSLITYEPDTGTVRVHRLVQRAIRDEFGVDLLAAGARGAADALTEIWPDIERDSAYLQTLRANSAALRASAGDLLLVPEAHPVLFVAATSLGEAGQFAAAAAAFEELLGDCERVLGDEHPDTLIARANLAYWRGEAGDPVGAATALDELLSDRERILGPDHPDTLATRANLAYWRGEAGDRAGAVDALGEVLDSQLRVLGPDHLQTLVTRANLARWRGEAGDPVGAAAALAELAEDQVRILGPDHPYTLDTRANLAYWRGNAGGALLESVSGPSDPATVAQAVVSFRQALRAIPAEHPDRPVLLSNLGNALFRQYSESGSGAAVAEAIALFQEALRELPDGAAAQPALLSNLGNALRARFELTGDSADLDEAIRAGERAVEAVSLGSPARAAMLSNLGNALGIRFDLAGHLTDLDKAIELFREAVAASSPDSPVRSAALANLGSSLHRRFDLSSDPGDLEEAEEKLRWALAVMPPGSPSRAAILADLATLQLTEDRPGPGR